MSDVGSCGTCQTSPTPTSGAVPVEEDAAAAAVGTAVVVVEVVTTAEDNTGVQVPYSMDPSLHLFDHMARCDGSDSGDTKLI